VGKLAGVQKDFADNILIPVVDKDGALSANHICGLGIDSKPKLRAHDASYSYWRPHPKCPRRFDNPYGAGK
jgi:hypothetical protein